MSPTIKPVKFLFAILLMLPVFLSACSAQATPTPEPTTAPVPMLGQLPGSATKVPAAVGAVAPTETVAPTEIVAPTEPVAPTETLAAVAGAVSFSKDIAPILESRCLSCHGGEKTSADLSMKTYDALMTGSENGVVLIPGDADNSLLIKLLLTNKMPKRGPKLLPAQVQLLIDWVKAGALNN